MNKRIPLFLLAAAISPAALLLVSGCSKNDSSTTMQDAKTAASNAIDGTKVAVVNTWDSIKDYTYDKRVEFSADFDRMSKDMDDKAAALKAKMSGAPDAASKDRDAAQKEYDAARADLKARMNDLSNATADTWTDAKAKVAEAWKRVQAAWDNLTKANASP